MLDRAAMIDALKEYYASTLVKALYEEETFFTRVAKNTKGGGKYYAQPIMFGGGGSPSPDFATAQANITPPNIDGWQVPWTQLHQPWRVSGLAQAISENGDKTSFAEAMVLSSDGALNSIKRSICPTIFRDGSGSIGRISAASHVADLGTDTITLASINEIVNFAVGQRLVASETLIGAIDTGGVGTVVIRAIDAALGRITITAAAWNGAAAIADIGDGPTGHFLFLQGHARNGGARQVANGIADWIPFDAPVLGTLFNAVDRAVHRTRLAGVFSDQRGVPIAQAHQNIMEAVAREGMGRPDTFLETHENYTALINALGSKVNYVDDQVAGIGFQGVRVTGSRGAATVYADYNMQPDRLNCLSMKTWMLVSAREVPHLDVVGEGTQGVHVVSNADAIEGRWKVYYNLACSKPGANGVAQVA